MRLGRERPRKRRVGNDGRHVGAASMRLGRERPRKRAALQPRQMRPPASMRLGRERPRKVSGIDDSPYSDSGFNEAGARTPQKA